MRQLIKRLLYGSGAGPRKVWFGMGAGARFQMDPAHHTQRMLGLYEAEIAGDFRRCVKRARTLIDVGASDGYFSIIALRLNAQLTAIACEAHEPFEEQARQNYLLNFPDDGPPLEWLPKAVGSGAGQVTLDAIAKEWPGPFLVKIDVDGGEIDVLQSAPTLLARHDCTLILEVHSPELETGVIDLLQSQHYACRIIKNAWWRCLIPEQRPIELNRWVFAEKVAK